MASVDLNNIPGFQEAKDWEARVRAHAFLDLPYLLCGIEVSPLTLYRLAILETARSPFVCGGEVTPEDVALFLWVLSPDFRAGDTDSRAVFIARLRDGDVLADLPDCIRQIEEFKAEMFLDSPSEGSKSQKAVTSSEAVYCHIFGNAYGWSANQTVATALPVLYQLLRKIVQERDEKARFFNRHSDKVRGDWLDSMQSQGGEPPGDGAGEGVNP